MGRVSNEKKLVGKWRHEKKQASLQSWMERLKKGRGAKRRSPSPPPPTPLSFFKVMIGNFRDVLFIPPMAACTLKGLRKKYIRIEDSDANSWSVKLSIVDGTLAFQSGWHDFVTDHSITVGEFVIFTYNGGSLFTARVFGTSSLERVNFRLRKSSNWRIKQRSNAELDFDSVRIPKRQKAFQTSKHRHGSHTSENMCLLKKEIEVDPSDCPKVNANESGSMFEEVQEDPSAGWKFHHQNLNTREPNEGLKLDSTQTWCVNSDPKIAKELDVVSDTDLVELDVKNHEAFVNESITNSTTSEQRAVCLMSGGTLAPEVTGKPCSMTKFASSWEMNEHVENKKRSAEMNTCQMQDSEIDCRMEISGTMEEKHSNSSDLASIEALEEMMANECNLKHEKHSPKVEVNLTEPEGIACEVLHAPEGLCHTFDEKSTKLVLPSDPSTDILRFTKDEKKDLMPTSELYEEHQSKAVKQEAFTNDDEKDFTPCSGWRSPIEVGRTDLIEVPSSNCTSFTVCILEDVQPSLELPENLASQIGKLKHERKVFVLQDPSLKCWPVLYLESLDYVGFIGGWIDFAIGNNICKGDICEFELIDKKKLLFRVQIRKE